MAKKETIYKWIRMGGLISFIPVVLATGPLMGYFAGLYLKSKFYISDTAAHILIFLGLIFSITETVRIIKTSIKTSND